MDDQRIEFMKRTGFTDRQQMEAYERMNNRYLEDIFGEEIKKGDTYFEDEHGQLVHEDNLVEYVIKDLNFKKVVR